MKSRRLIVLGALAAIALLPIDLWSFWLMTTARNQADVAIRDASSCQRLSQQILSLQTKPAVANTREEAQEALSARIESAAHHFGINGDNLASIDPEPAVRVADTVYLEKPTVVQLRQITVEQLIDLLWQLSSDGSGLRVKTLRLSVPPENQESNAWSAELTVTYLIYAPPQQQATGRTNPNQW